MHTAKYHAARGTYHHRRVCRSRQDRAAIARILALDAAGLFDTVRQEDISMCGCVPVTVALLVALALGAKKAELVRYTDSGEASGNTTQVYRRNSNCSLRLEGL